MSGSYKSPLNIDPLSQNYQDKINIEYIFNRQIERCLLNIGTPFFSDNVEALLRLLPPTSFHTVYDQNDKYIYSKRKFVYNSPYGFKIGSIDNPRLYDNTIPVKRLEDNSIDWSDPNIKSPRMVGEVDYTDYHELFRLILEEAQDIGILWNIETLTKVINVKTSNPMKNPTRRRE